MGRKWQLCRASGAASICIGSSFLTITDWKFIRDIACNIKHRKVPLGHLYEVCSSSLSDNPYEHALHAVSFKAFRHHERKRILGACNVRRYLRSESRYQGCIEVLVELETGRIQGIHYTFHSSWLALPCISFADSAVRHLVWCETSIDHLQQPMLCASCVARSCRCVDHCVESDQVSSHITLLHELKEMLCSVNFTFLRAGVDHRIVANCISLNAFVGHLPKPRLRPVWVANFRTCMQNGAVAYNVWQNSRFTH
mmetsp:Transcript_64104/g.122318  ORF Transcript_64104/g.122318 Transcript_64104/m.122318 type:complete len:254 (+) Transcript_64104:536-1297(+)